MSGKHKNHKSYTDPNRSSEQRLSERERVQILSLYQATGWKKRAIARHLNLAYSTVQSCIKSGIFTPQKSTGRKPIINIPKRQRFIQRATLNTLH